MQSSWVNCIRLKFNQIFRLLKFIAPIAGYGKRFDKPHLIYQLRLIALIFLSIQQVYTFARYARSYSCYRMKKKKTV